MANKEDTIRMLNECIKIEERAVEIYTRHINNSLFFRIFSKEEISDIRRGLGTLSEDSRRHKMMFESFLAKIETEGKDVY